MPSKRSRPLNIHGVAGLSLGEVAIDTELCSVRRGGYMSYSRTPSISLNNPYSSPLCTPLSIYIYIYNPFKEFRLAYIS